MFYSNSIKIPEHEGLINRENPTCLVCPKRFGKMVTLYWIVMFWHKLERNEKLQYFWDNP